MRGNVLDLAVGVIIGGAFGAIIGSLSADVLMPLVGLIFGQPDFSAIVLGPLKIGNLLNAIVSFLITALALYFFVVAPMNAINERQKPKAPPAPPATRTCPECLSEVPVGARRCAFCTSELPKS
ncbi:large conductance mechanosensitive channel protein [Oscillochloris trichoides DG-6]|uniref:Large conductance mechanosensitive channel protein n=1 Tax=Oscillochloris trichoides DG-6 TaxID=765420 RepID=E1IFW3_9CHLR|nr:large conductance mechanosensitive channel protein [Oscillochloris trichoides DG-6]